MVLVMARIPFLLRPSTVTRPMRCHRRVLVGREGKSDAVWRPLLAGRTPCPESFVRVSFILPYVGPRLRGVK